MFLRVCQAYQLSGTLGFLKLLSDIPCFLSGILKTQASRHYQMPKIKYLQIHSKHSEFSKPRNSSGFAMELWSPQCSFQTRTYMQVWMSSCRMMEQILYLGISKTLIEYFLTFCYVQIPQNTIIFFIAGWTPSLIVAFCDLSETYICIVQYLQIDKQSSSYEYMRSMHYSICMEKKKCIHRYASSKEFQYL